MGRRGPPAREAGRAGQRRALTDAELIAILIGSGNRDESAVELSKRILHHYGNDLNKLGQGISIDELSQLQRHRRSQSNLNYSCAGELVAAEMIPNSR